MPKLEVTATEGSTYVVTAAFYDEDGSAVVPNQATWTLTDMDGNVINSRQDVSISPLAESVDILLTGDDLAIAGSGNADRLITVKALYDSTLGNNLSLKESAMFTIRDLATE